MLIGDAREAFDGLRRISEKLGSETSLSDEETSLLKDLELSMEGAVHDCEQTLKAVEAVELEGIQKVLSTQATPEPKALKAEVDKIVATLEVYDD